MCNRPVSPIEHYHPVYDDGGSIDAMEIEVEIPELCAQCTPNVSDISVVQSEMEEVDELPF